MRVLIVYCHPVPESFCAALRDAAMETLSAKGHEVRLIDLYAEGFDPVMRADERRRYNDLEAGDNPAPEHAAHLKWAEALIFVYPTWWYGLPAMLKGWLDRVWTPETAFSISRDGGAIKPLMTNIARLGVITTCGAPTWWSWLVGHPGRKTDPARHTRALRAALQDILPGALPDGCFNAAVARRLSCQGPAQAFQPVKKPPALCRRLASFGGLEPRTARAPGFLDGLQPPAQMLDFLAVARRSPPPGYARPALPARLPSVR